MHKRSLIEIKKSVLCFDYREIPLNYNNIPLDLTCKICHSIFYKPVVDQFSNVYCKGCIFNWVEWNPICPLTKKPYIVSTVGRFVQDVQGFDKKLPEK